MNLRSICLTILIASVGQTVNNGSHLKSWQNLQSFAAHSLNQFINSSLVSRLKTTLKDNRLISSNCSDAINHYIDSIASLDYWAVKMLDSSGKIASGLLEGTLNDMGSYDQCLEVSNASYCLTDMNIAMPPRDPFHSIATTIEQQFAGLSQEGKAFHHLIETNIQYFHYIFYRLGICLPSVCSETDVKHIIKSVLKESQIGLELKGVHCQVKTTWAQQMSQLSAHQIISILYLSFLVIMAFIGSLNHLICGPHCNRFLKSFSVQNNWNRLSNTGKQTMTCLHGLRLWSIVWVILGHCYGWISFQTFRRPFGATQYVTSFWFQPVMHGSLAVNTFFMISGLLTLYISINQYTTTKSFNALVFILHRIWRFLPHLLLTLSLTFVSPLLGSGPVWHEIIDPVVDNCHKNWWTNVLFINYLIDTKNICLLHTWYLGCDLHLYILSLAVIMPLIYGRNRLAIVITSLLLFTGTLSTGVILAVNHYPPTLLFSQPKIEQRLSYVLDFYIKPISHLGSYGIGLFLAIVILRVRSDSQLKKFLLQAKVVVTGWLLSITTIICLLFSIYPWNNGSKPSPIVSIVYGSLHRTLWSAAFAWIVFACIHERGGPVNSILSFRALTPLSRLTFSVYLVHPVVHWLKLGSIRERMAVNHLDGLYAFIPTVVFSFVLALICTLLCESPLLAIENRYFRQNKCIKQKTN